MGTPKKGEKGGEDMTGGEIVSLICKLEEEGMSVEKIMKVIKDAEKAASKDSGNK